MCHSPKAFPLAETFYVTTKLPRPLQMGREGQMYRTAPLKEYPEALNRFLGESFRQWLQRVQVSTDLQPFSEQSESIFGGRSHWAWLCTLNSLCDEAATWETVPVPKNKKTSCCLGGCRLVPKLTKNIRNLSQIYEKPSETGPNNWQSSKKHPKTCLQNLWKNTSQQTSEHM